MSSQWSGKSKGTVAGYKIFLYLIRVFGVPAAYRLLKFVSFYYYLMAHKQRNSLLRFYTGALNFTASRARTLGRKNFYIFGQTLVDRSAYHVGRARQFTHAFEGEEHLLEMQSRGKGGILLSAHVGNWEMAGNLLLDRVSSKINVVMYDAEVEKIKNYLATSTGGSRFNMIPIKNDFSHVIHIKNALDNRELVAIHADRYLPGAKTLEMDFLGRKAKFPLGPFIVASKFNAPVTFVYAIKESDYHYVLTATVPVTHSQSPEQIAQLYVSELENKVKLYPEHWFNYYDFYN